MCYYCYFNIFFYIERYLNVSDIFPVGTTCKRSRTRGEIFQGLCYFPLSCIHVPFRVKIHYLAIRKQYLTKYKGRRHYICFKYLPKYKLSDLISKPARHFSTPLHARFIPIPFRLSVPFRHSGSAFYPNPLT